MLCVCVWTVVIFVRTVSIEWWQQNPDWESRLENETKRIKGSEYNQWQVKKWNGI